MTTPNPAYRWQTMEQGRTMILIGVAWWRPAYWREMWRIAATGDRLKDRLITTFVWGLYVAIQTRRMAKDGQ